MLIIPLIAALWSPGVVETGMVNLACTYVVRATINASVGIASPKITTDSGRPKSIHRNLLLSGIRSETLGSQMLRESFNRSNCVDARARMMLWYSAIMIGNWMSVGRQELKGLMPFSR